MPSAVVNPLASSEVAWFGFCGMSQKPSQRFVLVCWPEDNGAFAEGTSGDRLWLEYLQGSQQSSSPSICININKSYRPALLGGLSHADRGNDGMIEVSKLAGYVDRPVPEITEKAFHVRQLPHMTSRAPTLRS